MRVTAFTEHEDVIKKILRRWTSPQTFGLVGGEGEAVITSQRAALDSGFISSFPLSGRSLRRRPICG